MAAQMSGETARAVWEEMPLARAYQYEQIFYATRGYKCVKMAGKKRKTRILK